MIRFPAALLAAALALLATAAQAQPERFTLVCEGLQTPALGTPEPFRAEYRVDLGANRYCTVEPDTHDCARTLDLQTVDAAVITFTDTDTDMASVHVVARRTVNRATGAFRDYAEVRRAGELPRTLSRVGVCRREAFRPLP